MYSVFVTVNSRELASLKVRRFNAKICSFSINGCKILAELVFLACLQFLILYM